MVFIELFGLFVGGLGGFLVYNAARVFRASARRDAYEPVTARVQSTDLERVDHSGGQPQYSPAITYEYTVDGEMYTNDNLYPGPVTTGSSDREKQEELLNRYPEGETVEAYYDPDDPSVSFLEKESRKRQAASLGILGGILLLAGLAMITRIPF